MMTTVSGEFDLNDPEQRGYFIALAASREPLRQLPLIMAQISHYPAMTARLTMMLMRYNSDQFDRLTAQGYRLNMLTETYEKIQC